MAGNAGFSERQSDSVTLVGVALAGAVAIIMGTDRFNFWTTLVGLVLFLVLVGYGGSSKESTRRQDIAFSSVFPLCIVQVLGIGIDILDV